MDNLDKIRQFIFGNFFVPEGTDLKDDDPLLEHGVVDSTGVLEVIRFIEETFGVSLNDDEIVPENLGSIAAIATFVAHKKQAASPNAAPSTTA
jgi:acyl carrier protein